MTGGDPFDTVLLGAAADSAAPGASGRWHRSEPCRNCGDTTHGSYCPTCGQKKVDVRVRLRDLIAEALDDHFSISGRLPRTIGTLLFKPGRLTRAYAEGRMARFVAPFRLYIVTSVLFFLLLTIDSNPIRQLLRPTPTPPATPVAEVGAVPDDGTPPVEVAPGRVSTDDLEIHTPWPALNELLLERARRFEGMEGNELRDEIGRAIVDRLPFMFFLLLPFFALLLKILHVRHRRFYVEHFIFSLHFHAFVFAVLIVDRLAGQRFAVLAWLYIFLYLFLALRHFYAQSRSRTLVKYVLLVGSYVVFGSALFAAFLVSVLLII